MRILYDNQIDALTATGMTALTAETLYPITEVQDQRLTTQWRSTAATDQTVVFDAGGTVAGGDGQPMFPATTNLLANSTDFTQADWAKTNVTASASGTILGLQANLVTKTVASAANAYIAQSEISTATAYSILGTLKYGTDNAPSLILYNASTATNIVVATVDFSAKSVAMTSGTKTVEEWIDDYTVRIGAYANVATVGNAIQGRILFSDTVGANATVIASAMQLTSTSHPYAYTATTRAAWVTSGTVSYHLPPSGKFIVDCEFTPYFKSSNSTNNTLWSWYAAASKRLTCLWVPPAFNLRWQDGSGSQSLLAGATLDAGTAQTINQSLRMVASIDISASGTQTGSRFFTIPKSQGSFSESTTWSIVIDGLSSTSFTTFRIGHYNNSLPLQGNMRYLRIYGGTLEDTITTEQDLDAELATKELTYDVSYADQFTVDAAAILGHNISSEADIKVELNDWDEWNYIDGSGSSIIQHTMTWDEDTILKFLDSRAKRKYVRYSINDPNNDAGYIAVGRFWVGEHLDISPSSLLNFSVTKARSDRVIYGRNRQKWADEGVGWRRFELSFPRTEASGATSMLGKIERMYDTVGHHSSVVFCNFDTIRDYPVVEPVYCSITEDIGFRHTRHQKYEWSVVLEEDL